MTPQIGLQTFTIRRHLRSPGAIDHAFATMARLGLQAVELAYVKLRPEYVDALESAGRTHGIAFRSSQITFKFLDEQRDWAVRLLEQLGCPVTAVSVLPFSAIRGGRDELLRFNEQLDGLGQWYREHGVQLCFHHHDFEYRRYGDELGMDLIVQNTSEDNVAIELDTYWTQRGGRAPHDVINDLAGRVKVVHLRDYALRRRLFELLPRDAELGAGNLDIDRIVRACRDRQVQLLAIEQATNTPWESVGRSVQHLRDLGFAALFDNPTTSTDRENTRDTRQIQA